MNGSQAQPARKPRGPLAKLDHALGRFGLRPAPDWRLHRARKDPSYGVPVRGRRVLVTGASSGIGEAAARQFARLGAKVVVVARRREELEAVAASIRAEGGEAEALTCDLRDLDALVETVVARFGGVDVLVNNAGHSIRRASDESLERWHDLERTMQINYFSAMRLVRGFLPGMLERSEGHVINVSSWVVPIEAATRFLGYGAAKAALSSATRTLDLEFSSKGVHGTVVHFPLVRTPMIAPTEEYDSLAALTSEEAAEWIVLAARARPEAVFPRVSGGLRLVSAFSPVLADAIVKVGGRNR